MNSHPREYATDLRVFYTEIAVLILLSKEFGPWALLYLVVPPVVALVKYLIFKWAIS